MAKNTEAIEELADDVYQLKEDFKKLTEDVGSIRNAMKKLAEAADKPIPPPRLDDLSVRNTITNAANAYFAGHPVGKTLSENDLKDIAQRFYNAYTEARTASYEYRKNLRIEEVQVKQNLRKEQEIWSEAQIHEWAPEFPIEICFWLRVIAEQTFPTEWKGDFIKPYLKVMGNVLMAANNIADPTLKGLLKKKWRQVRNLAHKKRLLTYFILGCLAMSSITFLAIYQERVMRIDRVNRIWYNSVIKTRQDEERWHVLDSIAHTNESFYDRLKKNK